jgi:hypothetical protein
MKYEQCSRCKKLKTNLHDVVVKSIVDNLSNRPPRPKRMCDDCIKSFNGGK